MPRFSKKAKRHAAYSKQDKRRQLAREANPVTIYYLPGYEPVPISKTKFPFTATINGEHVTVMRSLYGQIEVTRQEV